MGLWSSIKKGIKAVGNTIKAIIKNPITAIAVIALAIYAPALALRLLVTTTISSFLMGATAKDTPTDGNSGVSGSPTTLLPDPSNKLPALYGSSFLSGMVTDAKISTDNQTMWYVIPLCESPDSGSIQFGEMYWGEKKITFSSTEAGRVVSFTNNAGQVDTKVDGNMWVYFYNDGSNSPTNGTTQTAISILSDAAIPVAARWDSSKLMSKTAFIIVKLIYNSDDGVTGLDQVKAQVINNQTGISDGYKPGSAMIDYLTNGRYGADLDSDQLNLASFLTLDDYSDQVITYTPVGGGSATIPRYRLNGAVDTSQNIMTNLQLMADSCDAYIQYNDTLGQWSVIANKAYDQAPNAQSTNDLFKFDDRNIIGGINITPLDLNSTPNAVESKFRNGKSRGRDDYAYATTPDRLKSFHEPFNQMNMVYAYVDDSVRAQYLSNRKLEQARADLVVDITADYSAIQVDAGDVVLLNYAPHGGGGLSWVNKPFRVIQVQEERTDDGSLVCKLQMTEYSSEVYDNFTIQDYDPPQDNYVTDPTIISTPITPVLSNILPSADIPSFQVSATIPNSGVVGAVEFWWGPTVDIVNNNYILYETQTNSSNSQYAAGDIETITVTGLPAGNYYWRVRVVGSQTKSDFSPSASINWSPVIVAPSSAGTNFEWNPTAIFCPSNSDGSATTVGQKAELYLRIGTQIIQLWDKTGTQPENTWYVDTLSVTTGLTTSAILNEYVSNQVSFTITGLAVDQGTATLSDAFYKPVGGLPNIDLGTSAIQVTKVKAGVTGPAGASGNKVAEVNLYQWSNTQPANPTGTSTFVWSTLTNTSYSATDGWSTTVGANPGTPGTLLWLATKSIQGVATETTQLIDWAVSPTVAAYSGNGVDGIDGVTGFQNATPTVYQWSLSTPSISGTSQYTWSSGAIGAGYSSGWTTSISASPSPGFVLWAARVNLVASGAATASTINWTTSSISSAGYSGTNGAAGVQADLTREVDVVFAANDGTGYTLPDNNKIDLYVGSTLQTTGVTYSGTATKNGLTATVNASTGVVVYSGASWTTNRETFSFTATFNSIIYSTTYSITKSRQGSDAVVADLVSENDVISSLLDGTGYTLPTGNSLRVYKGAALVTTGVIYSGTTTKNGLTFTINGTTGEITLSGASWTTFTESFTASAVLGGVTYSAIYTISKARQGATGTTGNQGASARRAYSRIPGSPSPLSGTITVTGDGRPTQAQSTTTWGLNYAWSATDPDTSSTRSLFQSDGIYNPTTGNTVWDTPYLSSLRVGQLSAITVNTGNLSVDGSIVGGQTGFDTGNGFFLGNSGSTYKFSIGNQNGSKLTWDGSTLNIVGDIKSNNATVGSNTSPGYWLQQSTGDARFAGNVYIGSNVSIQGVLSKGIINGNALPTGYNTSSPLGFTYNNPTNWTQLNAKVDVAYGTAGALNNSGRLATQTYIPKPEYFDVGATFPKRLITVTFNLTWSDPTNGTGPNLLIYLNGKTFSGTVPVDDSLNLQTQGPTAANPNGGWFLLSRGIIIGRSLPNNQEVTATFIDTSPSSRFFNGVNYFSAVLVKGSSSTNFTTTATNISLTIQEIY